MGKSSLVSRILQVHTCDIGGGADKVAWDLFTAYRRAGYHSWLSVGLKRSDDPDVLKIPNERWRGWWARRWQIDEARRQKLTGDKKGLLALRVAATLAEPYRQLKRFRGFEDFDFPATQHLLDLAPERPDILHGHNLHGNYFDLRVLPRLSQQLPVILTLHDAWLLSGHCAHSFVCQRWLTGCGQCPDLSISPSIHGDQTAFNWRRKKAILTQSKLYIATPSQWLMKKVEQSILAPAVVEVRVIPNGVDLSIFHPAEKRVVRAKLGIAPEYKVLLFAANGIRKNIWKDYRTMQAAAAQVAERRDVQPVLFLALGEDAPAERAGQAEIRFIPYQRDPRVVAQYYQAADVYIHAARADNLPLVVMEALACGTPVVATDVGGIPEMIRDGETGFLVPPGDSRAMAARIVQLLADDSLRASFGQKAATSAHLLFDLKQQVDSYLSWYETILERWRDEQKMNSKT
jgi:glycosyltransferase involved in cell wall biosynthesis